MIDETTRRRVEALLAHYVADRYRDAGTIPVDGGAAALFEVGFSVATVRTAMDRGARLGLGLTAGSLLAIAVILFTLFEREVVAPIERMHGLLSQAGSGRAGGGPGSSPCSSPRCPRGWPSSASAVRSRSG